MTYQQQPQDTQPPTVSDAQREEESRYHSERMAEIADTRDELVDEFLLTWLPVRRQHGETILECFDKWTRDKWPYVALNPAERGMLLHYVTHTPSGRTRILLSGKRGPDKFTQCREDSRISRDAIDRMKEGGDLARQEGETGLQYIERIREQIITKPPEPEPPVVEEQARLPYADGGDDQDALFE